jgi:hypothetical protein
MLVLIGRRVEPIGGVIGGVRVFRATLNLPRCSRAKGIVQQRAMAPANTSGRAVATDGQPMCLLLTDASVGHQQTSEF